MRSLTGKSMKPLAQFVSIGILIAGLNAPSRSAINCGRAQTHRAMAQRRAGREGRHW